MKKFVIISLIVLAVLAAFFLGARDRFPAPEQEQFVESERYMLYTPENFAQAAGKRRVLFFYAAWCPTCRPADAEFKVDASRIPDDVVLFRVDYDTETDLKAKYGITYQHTFVQVDENGNETSKWNGGDTSLLLKNLK